MVWPSRATCWASGGSGTTHSVSKSMSVVLFPCFYISIFAMFTVVIQSPEVVPITVPMGPSAILREGIAPHLLGVEVSTHCIL